MRWCCSSYLSGVLVLYPGADVRMQREVGAKYSKYSGGEKGTNINKIFILLF